MARFADRVKENTSTTGTGTVTLTGASAVTYRTFASAGVADGDLITYLIEEGNAWEIGRGTYSSGTVTRGLMSSSTGSLLNLSGAATVAITLSAADLDFYISASIAL